MATSNRAAGWLFGICAAVLGAGFLYFGFTGQDPVEDEIDRIVKMLNDKFGHKWNGVAYADLAMLLGSSGASSLITLARVVHDVEMVGRSMGWNGIQKRAEVRRRVAR